MPHLRQSFCVTKNRSTAAAPTIIIPAEALAELELVENMDWSAGVSLEDLVEWINWVASRFCPEEIRSDSRMKQDISLRTFRHYQTLGCVDAPERVGKQAVYRLRQYFQGLLIRKLLWERMPSEKIATLMAGRSTAEIKQLLLQGIKIVVLQSESSGKSPVTTQTSEVWKHVEVVPGIELHIRGDLTRPKSAEFTRWLSLLETSLRKNL